MALHKKEIHWHFSPACAREARAPPPRARGTPFDNGIAASGGGLGRALRLLARRQPELARRLANFLAEEAREVRGVEEAQPVRDLLDRHVAEDQAALGLGDDSGV